MPSARCLPIPRVGRVSLVLVTILLAYAGTPATSAAQPSRPDDPLSVVDTFLATRNAGDYWAAAGVCAALLELQDADDSWFVERATTSDWLRQLTATYLLDTLVAPSAHGTTVRWTERLTPRNMRFPEALGSSMTIEVSAVVLNGKIANLSAPYPPLPLARPSGGVPGERSGSEVSNTTVAPVTMFVVSALVLTLTALLIAGGASAAGALSRRRRPRPAGAQALRP